MGFIAFGPWATPKEVVYAAGAKADNFRLVDAAGFFGNFSTGTIWYNLLLALYFLLTIRYGCSDKVFATRVEPVGHGIVFCAVIVAGSLAASQGWYNPAYYLPGAYLMFDYPPGCFADAGVECQRGKFHIADWAGWTLSLLNGMVGFVLVFFLLLSFWSPCCLLY